MFRSALFGITKGNVQTRSFSRLSKGYNARPSSRTVFPTFPALQCAYPLVILATVLTLAPARTMFIQTETTPNEDSLKFIPGVQVMSNNATAEFTEAKSSIGSPLAMRLFGIDDIRSVFYGPDFVTISKQEDSKWNVLKPEIYSILMEHFSSNTPLFRDAAAEEAAGPQDTKILDTDTEIVAMIKELLDTRIRPAIMEDGGDIEYRGFEEDTGMVKLKLKGSCRGCSSSSVTLKSGIERMLMHYIPEVKTVEQVLDQEEEIALDEFSKFEKRLEEKDKNKQDLSQYMSL